MTLPRGARLTLAVLIGAASFLGLYLVAELAWWMAVLLAAALYVATLLLVSERPSADEVMVTPQVSLADIRAACATLNEAANEIGQINGEQVARIQPALDQLEADLRAIAEQVARDPEDYRRTRRFTTHFLPHILTNIRNYAELAKRAPDSARLKAVGQGIEAYAPVVHRINLACLENDFAALEAEVGALDQQLSRRGF